VLLQVLDDGRLTDGQGRWLISANVIIVMTSNLGSDYILTARTMEEAKPKIDEILKASFRPELLNRIDEILTFNRLGKEQILAITEIQLSSVAKRLQSRRLTLRVSESAKRFLADVGYDPLFGARPLKRAIQSELENPLAKEVLAGNFPDGSTITADHAEGKGIVFTKA
jgi:ATP-dependent Clp protease ATP-binding subunit ClpB